MSFVIRSPSGSGLIIGFIIQATTRESAQTRDMYWRPLTDGRNMMMMMIPWSAWNNPPLHGSYLLASSTADSTSSSSSCFLRLLSFFMPSSQGTEKKSNILNPTPRMVVSYPFQVLLFGFGSPWRQHTFTYSHLTTSPLETHLSHTDWSSLSIIPPPPEHLSTGRDGMGQKQQQWLAADDGTPFRLHSNLPNSSSSCWLAGWLLDTYSPQEFLGNLRCGLRSTRTLVLQFVTTKVEAEAEQPQQPRAAG